MMMKNCYVKFIQKFIFKLINQIEKKKVFLVILHEVGEAQT